MAFSLLLWQQMMLRTWNDCIFVDIRFRLQAAAINLLGAERNGEAFDSQLVIGVRESYGASVMCVCVTSLSH